MSLMRKVIWNSASQFYIAIAGIVVLPIYVSHFGAESYGLIAFMLTLQAFMGFLDLGVSASLSREATKFSAGVTDKLFFQSFLNVVFIFFLATGLLSFTGIVFSANQIASGWLSFENLNPDSVIDIIRLSAVLIILRWLSVYYRAVVFGFNQLEWLSFFSIIMTTMKFVVVLPLIYFFQIDLHQYFLYQISVHCLELIILALRKRSLFHSESNLPTIKVFDDRMKSAISFSLSAGAATLLWVGISQLDKILASAFLSLAEYGYFHVAITAASVTLLITAPIINSLQPRMTALIASDQKGEAYQLFKLSSELISVIALSIVIVVFLAGKKVLFLWSGNTDFVSKTADVFQIYVLANALLAVNSCSYILDYASGRIKRRNMVSVTMLVVLLVLFPLALWTHSAMGAAYVWLAVNAAYFIFALPYMLKQYSKTLYPQLLAGGLKIQLCATALLLGVGGFFNINQFSESESPLVSISFITITTIGALALMLSCSKHARGYAVQYYKVRYGNSKN